MLHFGDVADMYTLPLNGCTLLANQREDCLRKCYTHRPCCKFGPIILYLYWHLTFAALIIYAHLAEAARPTIV